MKLNSQETSYVSLLVEIIRALKAVLYVSDSFVYLYW